jgi:hypothetical protein
MKGGSGGAEGARRYWPAFLRGDDASEIHARLSGDGDPLRLQERIARRLRELWIMLEQDRVLKRALASCAYGAASEQAPEDLEAWTFAKIDLAIDQLRQRDAEAEEREPGLLAEDEKHFPLLTECLLREPGRVRHYSVQFNALPELTRRAFFELLIEGRDVLEVIEGGPWNRESLRAHVLQALAVLDLPLPPEPKRQECP